MTRIPLLALALACAAPIAATAARPSMSTTPAAVDGRCEIDCYDAWSRSQGVAEEPSADSPRAASALPRAGLRAVPRATRPATSHAAAFSPAGSLRP